MVATLTKMVDLDRHWGSPGQLPMRLSSLSTDDWCFTKAAMVAAQEGDTKGLRRLLEGVDGSRLEANPGTVVLLHPHVSRCFGGMRGGVSILTTPE